LRSRREDRPPTRRGRRAPARSNTGSESLIAHRIAPFAAQPPSDRPAVRPLGRSRIKNATSPKNPRRRRCLKPVMPQDRQDALRQLGAAVHGDLRQAVRHPRNGEPATRATRMRSSSALETRQKRCRLAQSARTCREVQGRRRPHARNGGRRKARHRQRRMRRVEHQELAFSYRGDVGDEFGPAAGPVGQSRPSGLLDHPFAEGLGQDGATTGRPAASAIRAAISSDVAGVILSTIVLGKCASASGARPVPDCVEEGLQARAQAVAVAAEIVAGQDRERPAPRSTRRVRPAPEGRSRCAWCPRDIGRNIRIAVSSVPPGVRQ
jgi:hypothetical protein